MATFKVPYVPTNRNSWGPPSEAADADGTAAASGAPPNRFEHLPYAPFGRSDRIGRAADFASASFQRGGPAVSYGGADAFSRRVDRRAEAGNRNDEFQYRVDSEEASTFQLVDSTKTGFGGFGGPGGGGGGPASKRFQAPARRRAQANAQRLRQLNQRRAGGPDAAAGRYNQPQRTRRNRPSAGGGGGRGGRGGRFGGRGGRFGRGHWRDRVDRQASVSVRPDWRRVEEVDLGKLSKGTSPLSGLVDNSPPLKAEDLLWCGFLDQYNEQYDKVSTRAPAPLKRVETKEFYPVTTTDDPVIEKLAIEGKGTVFATDAILAHLMTCPRSVYPWDIVVQKLPGTGALFFDKRDASQFDYLTVHETSNNPPAAAPESATSGGANDDPEALINTPERLSLEATMINQNFTQQILRSSKFRTNFDLPNPFWDEEDNDGMEPASVAYRYRRFDLGGGVGLVARTELHGLAKKKGSGFVAPVKAKNILYKKKSSTPEPEPEDDGKGANQYMTAFALNEFDPMAAGGGGQARPGASINWREKIDSQAGAVLASELKNNSFKLARWTAQSILAGASQMKIGFVSRVSPKNAYEHAVLATQTYRPTDFASQITLNQGTMWGIMRLFIKLLDDQPAGKYVIMRDPNRSIVRIYGVPPGTFEDDDDEEEEDDDVIEEEGEGEGGEE